MWIPIFLYIYLFFLWGRPLSKLIHDFTCMQKQCHAFYSSYICDFYASAYKKGYLGLCPGGRGKSGENEDVRRRTVETEVLQSANWWNLL